MKPEPEQLNVDAFCGIVDVYEGKDMTSFSMIDNETCLVLHRIYGEIVHMFDVEA